MADLQQEFDVLNRALEEKRRQAMEAEVKLSALQERQKEYIAEAEQLAGVSTLAELELVIAKEEIALASEMEQLRSLLGVQ